MVLSRLSAGNAVCFGALLENPGKWSDASSLTSDDFHLSDHRKIFAAILRLRDRKCEADTASVYAELGNSVSAEYLSDLIDGIVKPNLPQYVRMVRKAARDREIVRVLASAQNPEDRATLLAKLQALQEPPDVRDSELIVVRGDEVAEKPLRWVWKPYLPLGKLVHFGGNSSQAKSPVTVDLAARISAAAHWPDGSPNTIGPRSVILLNVEDDFEDTILPRFRLAGGDKSKLHYVKGTRISANDSKPLDCGVILADDMHHLVGLAKSLPDLGLIILDPITNYLGTSKMNAEEQMRALLTPLAALAAELGIVVITVGHFNRRERGTDPLHRIMGAAAFGGVARAVYTIGPDPEEESKYCHVMAVGRACGGEGSALRYRTELVVENCPDSFPTDIVKVIWTGKSDATAEDIVDSASSLDKARESEAAMVLKNFLRDGRKPANDCTAMLKAEGYDLDKLNAYRIRHKAGAESKKFPNDRFYSWYLGSPG